MKINKKKREIKRVVERYVKGLLGEHGGMDNGYSTEIKCRVGRGSFEESENLKVTVDGGEVEFVYLPDFKTVQDDKELAGLVKYYYQGGFIKDLKEKVDKEVDKYFGFDISYKLKIKSEHIKHGCFKPVCKELKLDI